MNGMNDAKDWTNMNFDNVLIVTGHPDISEDSVANKAALEELEKLLPGAVVDRLDLLYPDFDIDVETEQKKLVDADIIIWLYPVFWYAMPALLQKWVEDVFLHGFAMGSTGTALQGKKLIIAMTIGAPEEHYAEGEAVVLSDLLIPARGIIAATGMELAYWDYIWGVSYATRVNDEARANIAEKARKLASRVAAQVETLEGNL